jgi:hypothetical protein
MKIIPIAFALFFVLIVFVATSCAPHPNTMEDIVRPETRELAGFWLGLWHGMIATLTFIISWFTDSVTVYEIHNNGGWYHFGFLLGVGAFTKGATSASSRARRD